MLLMHVSLNQPRSSSVASSGARLPFRAFSCSTSDSPCVYLRMLTCSFSWNLCRSSAVLTTMSSSFCMQMVIQGHVEVILRGDWRCFQGRTKISTTRAFEHALTTCEPSASILMSISSTEAPLSICRGFVNAHKMWVGATCQVVLVGQSARAFLGTAPLALWVRSEAGVNGQRGDTPEESKKYHSAH